LSESPQAIPVDPAPGPIVFGTDGWRGRIAEDFTMDAVRLVSQAYAQTLRQEPPRKGDRHRVVMGYDLRFASERFAAAAAEILVANQIDVVYMEKAVPTQVSSYTVMDLGLDGGVVITASHNPWTDNGFKIKSPIGSSADEAMVKSVEAGVAALRAEGTQLERVPFDEARKAGLVEIHDPNPAYFAQIARMVDLERIKAAGLRIVADPMYGAGNGYLASLLGGGATTVTTLNNERNPYFGGVNPEPIALNLRKLMGTVQVSHGNLGIATDGDADRVGIVDEEGTFINQLQVFGLLLYYLLEVRGERGPVVKTVTTTYMAERLGEIYGVPVHEVAVGFKWVAPEMVKTDALMGGEESGGFGFRGHIPERDGLLAGLYIADLCVSKGQNLSQVLDDLQKLAGPSYYARNDIHLSPERQEEQKRSIRERLQGEQPATIAGKKVVRVNRLDGDKFICEDGSWVLLRLSGTEPLLRIYAEAQSPETVEALLEGAKDLIGLS
jgi:alpha-D-glucose phosphate-specific phosphoglucomutase